MKIIKLVAAVVIIVMLAAVCFAGCAEQTVEITVKVSKTLTMNCLSDPTVATAAQFLKKASDAFALQYGKPIKINVVEFESGKESNAVTNTFGTARQADVLYDDFWNMTRYVVSGNAIPLDGLLPQNTMDDLNEEYLESGRYYDRQYMMPFAARPNVLIYNKELMRLCNLDDYVADEWRIQNWTTEQWSYILDELVKKLPDNAVPMMMYASNQGDGNIMTFLHAFGAELYDAQNGKFDCTDQKVVDALTLIQSGVTRGWYMTNSFDKTMSDCLSKFKVDGMVFYNFNLGSPLYDKVIREGVDKYGFVNYPDNRCTVFCAGFEIFDNGNQKKIDAAQDFVRYIYETEQWLDCSAGAIPVSQKVMDKYRDEILLMQDFVDDSANAVNYIRFLPYWQGEKNSTCTEFYKEIAKLLKLDGSGNFAYSAEDCAKALDKKLNTAIEDGRNNSRPHN